MATETPDERAAALHCLRIATSLTLTPQCLSTPYCTYVAVLGALCVCGLNRFNVESSDLQYYRHERKGAYTKCPYRRATYKATVYPVLAPVPSPLWQRYQGSRIIPFLLHQYLPGFEH